MRERVLARALLAGGLLLSGALGACAQEGPSEEEVRQAIVRMIRADRPSFENTGLRQGANFTYNDLQVVQYKCKRAPRNEQTDEDYLCGIAYGFVGLGGDTLTSGYRAWRGNYGGWIVSRGFVDTAATLEFVGW